MATKSSFLDKVLGRISRLDAQGLQTIVAKVEATGPKAFVTDLGLLENRFQFRRHIQSLAAKSR